MEWLYELVTGGSSVNAQIQAFRSPFLDLFFGSITFLGNEEFYLIIIPLIYWIISKSFGRKLIYLLALTSYLNTFVKNWFDLPRPFEVDARITALAEETSYGLPSGHSQLSTTLGGYVAWTWRKIGAWVMPATALIIILIIFSRLYLGVHFPADVVVGTTLGLLGLFLWLRYEPLLLRLPQQLGDRAILTAAVLVPVLLLFIMPDGKNGYPAEDAATTAGILLGINLGFFYEARQVRFTMAGSWLQYLTRYLLGIVMVAFFWAGLRVVFNLVEAGHFVDIILRFARYGLTGCALVWWAPALFVRLGLAGREGEDIVAA